MILASPREKEGACFQGLMGTPLAVQSCTQTFPASSSGAGPRPSGCGVPTRSKRPPHLQDTFWGGTGLPRRSPSTAPGVLWAGKNSLAKVYVCGWG